MRDLRSFRSRESSALVIILVCITILCFVIIALLATTTLESSVSRQDYQNQASRTAATTGLHAAIAQIRTALGPWDNPYSNFCNPTGSIPTNMWTMSPGLITLWSYSDDSFADAAKYPLFSQSLNGDPNTVNLNAPDSAGVTPILPMMGGTNVPMQIAWADVLQNPAVAAGATNQIVARYAFWVDDESAKININTADGTMKYQTNSLGLGTPSEVSLQALQQDGADLSTTVATNIVYLARTTGFNSPQEILRAAGTTPDLYTNNVWNLTCSSRSPDLNMFGQPKMAILAGLGDSSENATNIDLNGVTLQPLTEIYPTPSQLSTYPITNSIPSILGGGPRTANLPWPLVFRAIMPVSTQWGYYSLGPNDRSYSYMYANYVYANGDLLAKYLNGQDAFGRTITWPPFTGSNVANFTQKYVNLRQLDSIVAQIISIASRLTSADRYFDSDYDGEVAGNSGYLSSRLIAAPLFTGWLSHQWVIGMGRNPKVTAVLLSFGPHGSSKALPTPVGPPDTQANYGATETDPIPYTPPTISMDIWLEWWMPPQYLGGSTLLASYYGGQSQIDLGFNNYHGLNYPDLEQTVEAWRYQYQPTFPNITDWNNTAFPQYSWVPSALPSIDSSGHYAPNFWANTLLNIVLPNLNPALPPIQEGIDFQENPTTRLDPQLDGATSFSTVNYAAQNYHPFEARPTWSSTSSTQVGWSGTGLSGADQPTPPFVMTPLMWPHHGEWSPGELRVQRSEWGSTFPLVTADKAMGQPLQLTGGIQVRSVYWGASDVDPVPLESIRGTPNYIDPSDTGNPSPSPVLTYFTTTFNGGTMPDQTMGTQTMSQGYGGYAWTMFDDEHWNWSKKTTPAADPSPGDPDSTTVLARQIGSVIPLSVTIQMPSAYNGSGAIAYAAGTLVGGDPIVNKFPGDWTCSKSDPSDTVIPHSSAFDGSTPKYNAYVSGFQAGLPDPDAFWVPQMDVNTFTMNNADLAAETIIPRGARMPSIGYLNYVRTGIMPDAESSTVYALQHGTPYRLLSYAPSDTSLDPSDQKISGSTAIYPDWAMLDLFYVPFFLNSYGSPYGFYNVGTTTWNSSAVGGNPSVLAHYSTYGGSTPGRINLNGAVLYTTDVNTPMPGVTRTLPLQAVMQNLVINGSLAKTTLTTDGEPDETDAVTPINPGLTSSSLFPTSTLDAAAAAGLASDIASYIASNGPMRLPEEICNVASIYHYRPNYPNSVADPGRNDLMRSIIGELTTQTNVFSIWTVGQVIQKNPSNKNYGQFEAGDKILGQTRMHYIVERYLDPGSDGFYGNSSASHTSGTLPIGTYQDPMDANLHPMYPAYLYRVLSVEEIK